jgi:hypothetical protein
MFTRKNKKIIYIVVLTTALLLALSSIAMAAVWTDQSDYSPGSVVTISGDNRDGAGYLAGETVKVVVAGPNGYEATCEGVAGGEGAWNCTVTLWNSDLAVGDYIYTAVGQTSKVNQSGTFTDGNAKVSGYVKDSADNPIENAVVSCTSNCTESASTNTSGYYEFSSTNNNKINFSGGSTTITLTASKTGYTNLSQNLPVSTTGTYTLNFSLAQSMSDQTITVVTHAPGNSAYGDTFTIDATASSELPVTYSSSGGCSNEGAIFTMTSSSVTCVVHYNQAGDATYNPAPEVTENVTAGKATLTVTPDAQNMTYGDPVPTTYTFNVTGFKNSETAGTAAGYVMPACSSDYAPTTPIADSPRTISCSGGSADNYAFDTSATAELTIDPKAASVTPDAASKTYGDPDPAFTGTLSGFLAADGVTATYSRTAGETVLGSPYTISANLSPAGVLGNYDVTYNTASFTINKKAASVSAVANSKTYGDADPTLTTTNSGFLADDLGVGKITFSASRAAGESVAGSPYLITPSADDNGTGLLGNYDVTYNTASFTINKKTASVSAVANSKTYGDPDPTLSTTDSGFLAADLGVGKITFSASRATGESVAGSPYLITPSADDNGTGLLGNYDVTYNTANFTINPRPITVTADAKTKVLNGPDPALTYKITSGSLVGGDDFSGALTRVAGENVGSYAILQGTLTLGSNYDLTYVGANLTITYRTGGDCYGGPGHAILQPINTDGSSVFKQKSTVPAKFRVCDYYGTSIGTPGVVSDFLIVKITNGAESTPNETVDSTTPYTEFRWSASDQQWIFNISTKNYSANKTYYFVIYLNDGTEIPFHFGLK